MQAALKKFESADMMKGVKHLQRAKQSGDGYGGAPSIGQAEGTKIRHTVKLYSNKTQELKG